jgi:hypothetical protein
MNKKIALRTKIYLTIVGLLALTGVLYAANPMPFASVPFATSVAAAPDLLLVGEYCTDQIDTLDCQGNVSLFLTIPGFGSCREQYMAIAPSQSAAAGFTPRDVFVTQGALVYKATPPGPLALFATFPCGADDHNGITFDHFGTFGFNMIVTCENGGVWEIDGTGTVTPIASTGTTIEGPAVVPPGFGPHGGQIWVADENNSQVHAIRNDGTVTLNLLSHVTAEGVHVIPSPPCTFCSGGTFFQAEQQLFKLVWQYPLSDFTGLGGNVILVSESGFEGADTSLVTFDGTNYVQSSFGPRPPGVDEGAYFVDCDVPTATPTSTPNATFTPTPTATATAAATFTPTATATATPTFTPAPTLTATATFTPTATATATATFTPTATATFTPTATATATATPTPTPTPTASNGLIAYFNFEDAADLSPPDFASEADQGLGIATTITTNYIALNMATVPGFGDINRVAGDVDNPPNGLHALGLRRTFLNNGAHFDIPLFTSQGSFSNMAVSFATIGNGNGFAGVQLLYSTDGGATFSLIGPQAVIIGNPQKVNLVVPAGANNAPLLILRLVFTGGGPGNDLQTRIDNIQVNGTILP